MQVINQDSEGDFRAQSLLKTHIDLSPIRAGEADSPGLNDRDVKLQDFVEITAATKKVVPHPHHLHASQDAERARVKPLPLYQSAGANLADHPQQQSTGHGLANRDSAFASTLPLGSTLSKQHSPVKSHTKNHSATNQSPEMPLHSSAKPQRFAGLDPNLSVPQYQAYA